MLLTGHKSRAIFDRYNIINEQELLDAGDQLVAYLAQPAQAGPARRRPHTTGPAAPRLGCRGRLRYQIETSQGAPPPHPCSNRNARMPLLGVIAAYAFTEDACARTVQKRDRRVDGRSCITLLTDSRRATSHRAAGGTGRDPGVAGPSTAAGSGDGRAPGDSVRGGRARRTTAAGAAVVCLGDQSPVPAENRVRRDDAGDLHHDAPSELLAAHGESTALGIGQAKRPRAQVLPEDPILLPEIRDQIVLVAGHPASERENEEL